LRLTRDGNRMLKRAKALAATHESRLSATLGPDRHSLLLEVLRERRH
jgi:hypothetical protein